MLMDCAAHIHIVTKLLPRRFDAMTVWPFIFVRPQSAKDAALIEHELVHWREQAWSPLWWPRYLLSRRFRQAAEVRAYRRQIECGADPHVCARHLSTGYQLDLSHEAALELLIGNP